MDTWTALQALILGIVEGLTEFLPVSSTGHQIIAADLLGFGGARAQAFNIIIQFGAILAVMWEYRLRILALLVGLPRDPVAQRFTVTLLVAFLPAAIVGVLLSDLIHTWLFNPLTVASALVIGGVLMLWAERRTHTVEVESVEDMRWTHALRIGCAQCLALIPGTSRAAATIIGGLVFGLSRKAATEFSFWLAMPTMAGAAVYSGWKYRELFVAEDLPVFAIGFLTAFVVARLTVRALLAFIATHSYAPFAWYRIAFGGLILASAEFGWIDWSAAAG
ncbi:MAG: undecaprenyl-diphosphate phosphatase [Gammaproteobacteria bacterium]